jgi:tetratricopeptide (TPR) repeat protein
MGTWHTRLSAAFPRFGLRRLAIGLFAIALLVVFLFPNAHPVTQFVTIASVIGIVGAILCGLAFWPEARVRIARFLNSRNLRFRYKVVRRNAVLVALVGLSFWLVRVEVSGTTAKPFYNRGVVYADKGEYDRAIEDYNRAIELQPKYAEAFYSRGTSYAHKGEYDRAIQDFDQAIALKPEFAMAFYNRGSSYARKGEYDRAIQDLNQLITLEPTNAEVVNDRKFAYAHRKPPCPPADCAHG